ncbi:MAG TPA: hypothetical protein VK816_09050, partial [Jatrophihabitantaceae bacterium]|nr:hypothetical protein [Jatrophihabitantaceae bacterium]
MPLTVPRHRLVAAVATLALMATSCAATRAGSGVSALTKASTPTSRPTSKPTSKPTSAAATTTTPTPTRAVVTSTPRASTPPLSGQSLPLNEYTGTSGQVITVVAADTSSTVGSLQRWSREPSGRWQPVGSAVTADLGSDGLSTHPSESVSATPIGSFTLTQAFGHDADPGTALPYLQTTPADWWISQYGPRYAQLYNTEQRCAGTCPFTQGPPNEH